MKKWLWIGVGLLATAAVVWFVVGRGSASQAPKYRTEDAARGDVTMNVTATGSISAVITVQVGSQVSGIISKLYADFNSKVSQGQLLVELDPTPFEATVAQRTADVTQAQVQQRNAKIQFDRQARLLDQKLIAQSDYDTAKATLDGAQAQVDQAKAALLQANTNLTYTKIRSPITGVVVDRQYDIGQTVAASFQAPTLFTIAQDLTKMQVSADVDQSDIGRVQVGQAARFTVDAYPEEEFKGQITQVRLNATVTQNVITYPVIVEVPNPEEKLRPKMTANVSIEVSRVRDVLRVPNAALRFRPIDQEGPAAGANRQGAAAGGGASAPGAATGRAGNSGAGGGFAEAARQFDGAAGGRRTEKGWQTVYLLGAKDQLTPVKIRAGISDGRYTQVLEGEIKPGDKIVLGAATAKVEATGSRPMGGGRF